MSNAQMVRSYFKQVKVISSGKNNLSISVFVTPKASLTINVLSNQRKTVKTASVSAFKTLFNIVFN